MELIAAIIAPVLTGTISFSIYLNKKNNEFVRQGFDRLHGAVVAIERKVDDLRLDVAKNYVTNEELTAHITGEENWHIRFGEEMAQTRDECTATRVIVDRMWMDFQNKGNM
tara:strand:- start:175 stop:507 length:333 start_codon:yes stop_codon:yes gene_type:complete